ncbi:MAG: 16S rRNA (guanine(527)-N(7))-methyltransferase RsmG [Cyanobacteriota bacterium]|nr:16S rRNA (guanine(527)-N(7))-methyltransferase RsmG [Cyanobacteriota bacterium]
MNPILDPQIWGEAAWSQWLGWQPSATQLQQLQHLYHLVLAGNSRQNLTRITDPTDFWEKHLWDSLRGIHSWQSHHPAPPPALRVVDIGTGAGFPGIPVAIAYPGWFCTLLDATRKKVVFVEETLQALHLPNAEAKQGRAEVWGSAPSAPQPYDLALSRAVGTAELCAAYSLPLLRSGGYALLYRGQWTPAETAHLETVLQGLGGQIRTVDAFVTPFSQSVRHCIVVQKY